MNERERQIRKRLKEDYPHYAEKCLKIRTKSGTVEPLVLNSAQRYIHACLEEQLEKSGRVRAIVLKGRQQGCSTYIGGRFYHKSSHRKGFRTFILTHEQEATNNLFEMTNRYHDHCPALVKPSTSACNANELVFDKLDSGYKVGTAGTKGVGRSSTIQQFHGSEVAFWPFAETHAAGVLQAVPDAPDTEIILESTANGLGNFYHMMWQEAESGNSDYIAIFVPWYWQEEYHKPVPEGFALTDEEIEYKETYNLTMPQMVWRRAKIIELKDPLLFKQEYPATAAEAFQTTGHDSFIQSEPILSARKNSVDSPHGVRVVGVDPARFGDDSTAIVNRIGRRAFGIKQYFKKSTMQVAGLCKKILDDPKLPVKRMFIDVGGLGAGVYDRLDEMGYGSRIVAVNFGGTPFDEERYVNKRAEMWGEMKDWLDDERGVDIPDDDALHADLTGPSYDYDSTSRIKLESKEAMRKRGVRSPDLGDGLALTFAEPVSMKSATTKIDRRKKALPRRRR